MTVQASLFDGLNVVEVGKVCDLIGGRRWGLGSAGTTNTPKGSVCPVCAKVNKANDDVWLFWPLVGMVCVPCSRRVHDETPFEVLFTSHDGSRKMGLTRP